MQTKQTNPKNRRPTAPGEILQEEFLEPKNMTQEALAKKMGVPLGRVNAIINGRRAVTAETAIKLARVFGVSAEFWMNAQVAVDLWEALQREALSR